MARTLEEIDQDLATLEAEWANAKPRLLTLETDVDLLKTKGSTALKRIKAIFKRLKFNHLEPAEHFDHWQAERDMEARRERWEALAQQETE